MGFRKFKNCKLLKKNQIRVAINEKERTKIEKKSKKNEKSVKNQRKVIQIK